MSYVVPTNELTLTDIKMFRSAAIEAGITRALALGIARSRDELVVRGALPSTDFGGAAIGWTDRAVSEPGYRSGRLGFSV